MTREEWLNAAAKLMAPHFNAAGYPAPANLRMTCGFPSRSALSGKKQRIGECWSAESSGDKHFEVFISPTLDKPVEVLATLVHEIAHAAVGLKHKHKGPFTKCVRALHLEGKPTATFGGDAFKQHIANAALMHLGDYPHARLIASSNGKKQSTRLVKCMCPECGYTVRTTRQWIDGPGAPICPTDKVAMEEA